MIPDPSSPTTWRKANKGWLLFTNNTYKPRQREDKASEPAKKPSKFYFSSRKPETKGTVVYTPEGYGIIQDINPLCRTIPIKLNRTGQIKDFDSNSILLDIPITICFLSSGFKGEEKTTIPITINPKDIARKIEGSFLRDVESMVNIQVFYKGRDLMSHGHQTVEKMGILPDSKFIAISEIGIPFTVSRFTNVYEGWGYNDKCINAIAFSVSKSIKIRGFGIYTPDNSSSSEGRSFPTCAKLIKGTDDSGQVMAMKELQVSKSETIESKIFKFLFDRPVRVKPGEVYSCVQEAIGSYNCYSYYGENGESEVTGDKEVVFTFSECFTSVNNTNRSCGQIPEIYYYA